MASEVQAALGGLEIVGNLIAGDKAKKEAAILDRNRPIRTTSQFDRDSSALADSELAQGMSAKSERAYEDASDRGLATSVSQMLKAGGNPNDIGSIYTGSEQGRQNLSIIQDQLRLAQIQNVLKQQNNMADQDQTNWLVNEYGPYKDKLKAIGEARKNAAEGVVKGMDTFGAGVMGALIPKLPTTNPTGTGANLSGRIASPIIDAINPQAAPTAGVDQVVIPKRNTTANNNGFQPSQNSSSGDYDILGGGGFDDFWKTFNFNFGG